MANETNPNTITSNRNSYVGSRTFTAFNSSEDIVSNDTQQFTEPIWSTGDGELLAYYTSSTQATIGTGSGAFYIDVYCYDPATTSSATPQFAIAYGHKYGSGSTELSNDAGVTGLTPSKAIYTQYASLLLQPGDDTFTLGNAETMTDFIAINFNRSGLKERLDAGNWELPFSGSTCIRLIDNANTEDENTSISKADGGNIYSIISGSLAAGQYGTTPTYAGLAYPDLGILLINGNYLRASASLAISTASNAGDLNNQVFLDAMTEAAGDTYGFIARNKQYLKSTFYFVRGKNKEYNYSNNSTFISGSNGALYHSAMIGDPKTYITTVGLYNDNNELIAVAKLSQPLLKSFDKEFLIRVKLDY